MKFISHRGNIDGPNPEWENDPSRIEDVLNKGYDVEIDVWKIGAKLFLVCFVLFITALLRKPNNRIQREHLEAEPTI